MKINNIAILSIVIILTSSLLGGCQSSQIENKKYSAIFESDVVDLVNYTIDFNKDRHGKIVEVTVNGRIKNKVDRELIVKITAEFYDKNDAYIGDKTFTIFGLREKGKPGSSTTFKITYDGNNADKIDHVKLRAEEY